MAHIQREELHRLARSARLAVAPQSEQRIIREIDEILSYTDLLSHAIAAKSQISEGIMPQQELVMRSDEVMAYAGEDLLAGAPESESRYFVVPAIIAQEK